jgi:predicted AlkP superfamily phosphohydrolase/phosphomutase
VKVLIYGLDGGDVEIMKIFSDKMPFFKEFLEKNVNIKLTEDLFNRGWAEILTGKEGKNMRGFYMAPLLDGTHQFATSFKMADIKDNKNIIPIWELAEQKNASYCIMNVPTTTPAPKVVNGIVVGSAGGGLNKIEGIPSVLVSDEDTLQFLKKRNYIVDIRIPNTEIKETETLFYKLSEKEQSHTNCFIELCRKKKPDFGFLVNRGNCIVEYLSRSEIENYQMLKEKGELGSKKNWGHEHLENHFAELDVFFKRLYEELQPEHFIITADHNIVPSKTWANVHPFLIENGWLILKNNKNLIKNFSKKLLGPFYKKATKRLSSQLKEKIGGSYDWRKSVAFGSTFISGIYINDNARFGGPVKGNKDIISLVKEICDRFNSVPEKKRAGMMAVPYRSKNLDGQYSDWLPDIKIEKSEGIYFHTDGPALVYPNKNYGPIPKDLRKVTYNPFTGDKGANPICLMTNNTANLVRDNDAKNLTLVYKLVNRILN